MLFDFNGLLKKYTRLIAETGVAAEKGHTIVLQINVEQVPLTRLITQEVYKPGAAEVIIQWTDDQIRRELLLRAATGRIENVPQSKVNQADERLERGVSGVSIVSVDPDAFTGVDSHRVASYRSADSKALMSLHKATQVNKISWTVVATAGKQWATKAFPELPEEKQAEALWDQIPKTTRVYEKDPVLTWEKHDEKLAKKAEELNREQLSALHYTAPSIDIIIGSPKNHLWEGARSYNAHGERLMVNMLTEEVLIAPDSHRVDGYISDTRPLSYASTIISGIKSTSKDGKVVGFSAERGGDVLVKLLGTDKGACRLGEVALIPSPSPISQSDIIFFNTLFDENTSNHLALSSAYAFGVKGGVEIPNEGLAGTGLDKGQTHADSMVGSGKMDIDGIHEDDSTVLIFRNGGWIWVYFRTHAKNNVKHGTKGLNY